MAHDIKSIFDIFSEEEDRLSQIAAAEIKAEDAKWAALTPEERAAKLEARLHSGDNEDEPEQQDEDEDEDDWYL